MHPLVRLARLAVEKYIKKKEIISPTSDLPKEFLEKKAGVFVTIEKKGILRACIGTYLPTKKSIAEETIRNAIAAATEDWRLGSIQKEELPFLSYIIYILSPPEPVKEMKELDPKKYGIIVRSGLKTGLLLPDLEGINTIEKQILIACQKAGIEPAKEKFSLYRFTVQKYG